METFIARQPIFNKRVETVAYEILFRSSLKNAMPDIDGDAATSNVLSNTYLNMGIEELVGEKNAFINFTENLIVKKVPLIFPSSSIIVEILEDVNPTPELMDACKEIKDKGYVLAMDDFIDKPEFRDLIELTDIIKIDLRTTPISENQSLIERFLNQGKILLAEKVETKKEFKEAFASGFKLFQGYFFCRPEIIKSRDIPLNKVQLLHIISKINEEDARIDEIAELVQHDVGLAYKLLKYINSAFYRRMDKVTSIKDAAIILGLDEIKKLASLVLLTQMDSGGSNALLKNSAVRAKFCESLGLEINNKKYSPTAMFTMGLFSHIDALLGYSMNKILKELPLAPEINQAFLEKKGPLYPALVLISFYETANWEKLEILSSKLKIEDAKLSIIYKDACVWADHYFKSIM